MKNRLIAIMLALTLCLSLSGCFLINRNRNEAAVPSTLPDDIVRPEETGEEESDPWEETEEDSAPEIRYDAYQIAGFESTFSEGRAWVKYVINEDYKNPFYALIDESGVSYLESDTCGTPFSGGATALSWDGWFSIYNAEGECTFSHEDTPEYELTVVGSGDGIFAVVEHSTGFAGNVYKLSAIDAWGNFVCSKYDVESKYDIQPQYLGTEYMGEGIFFINGGYLNTRTDSFIRNKDVEDFVKITPFYEGKAAAVLTRYINHWATYFEATVTPDAFKDQTTLQNWVNSQSPKEFLHDSGVDSDKAREGYIVNYGSRYDTSYSRIQNNGTTWFVGTYDGRFVAYLPSYPDGVEYRDVGRYSGGYLPLFLKGADNYYYCTILDTEGRQVYEPVCLGKDQQSRSTDGYKFDSTTLRSVNGYIFYKAKNFTGETGYARIDPQGNITALPEIGGNWNEFYALDGDYLYFAKYATDYEGNIRIETILIPAGGMDPADRQEAPNSEDTGKEYINPSSFRIEGKWKSVGDYGFGQAQPGAIVIFDGEHCNLYSPSDTYAFYKDGDRFILDCTSPLADTVTFIVKIVDENHIDLYNGGYVTELSRVG